MNGLSFKSRAWVLLLLIVLVAVPTAISGKLHPEKVQFKDVTFNHEKHAMSGIKCTACHPRIFTMKKGANRITMSDIYKGKFCGHCHDGRQAFDIRKCSECHPSMKVPGKISYGNDLLGGVTFSHGNHLANRSLTCSSCHMKPFAMKAHTAPLKMRNLYDGLYCGKCHNGRAAFSLNRCSACHSAVGPYGGRNRDGTVGYRGGKLGAVVYSHRAHRSFNCRECHPAPFAMKGGASGISMAKMYRGDSCGKCHNGANAFSAKDCIRCHTRALPPDFTYTDKLAGNSRFSHKLHAKKGYRCFDCHDKLFTMKKGGAPMTMERFAKGRECGACHNGRAAFNVRFCGRCHSGTRIETISYGGGALKSVTFSHNSHVLRAGSCTACHPGKLVMKRGKNDLSMERMAKGAGCGACHNGVSAFSSERCALCHQSKSGETLTMPEATAGDVAFTHGEHFRREKSCAICHPKLFTPAAGKNAVTMKDMDEGKFCGACHDGKKAFSTGDCSLCHDGTKAAGGGVITWPGPSTGDVPFSHAVHRDRGLHCQDCHDAIFKRKKGASGVTMDGVNDGKFCAVCHNGTRAFDPSDCTKCHVMQ